MYGLRSHIIAECTIVYHMVFNSVLYMCLAKVLEQHKAELSDLCQRLDGEKYRQVISLREKLAARREQKLKVCQLHITSVKTHVTLTYTCMSTNSNRIHFCRWNQYLSDMLT